MGGQPFLRSLPARREMDEVGAVARAVEDTATADRRTFDDGEHQAGFQRKCAVDADRNNTAAAIVAFVEREAGRQADVAGAALVLLAYQPASAVVGLPLCRGRNYAE
ncbi:hypothetical protein HGO34_22840 [Agrobacterium vitis]|uniref:Uncharacterized protein n=1 Tax=Agrobacterium vitis TaxID=373 RepID=A0AAE2R7G8_AGRVI|nr:hypothetical protein [Agrobacterium vitis]MCM2442541.1 hypothetical protein [Agrobacterium vitis]